MPISRTLSVLVGGMLTLVLAGAPPAAPGATAGIKAPGAPLPGPGTLEWRGTLETQPKRYTVSVVDTVNGYAYLMTDALPPTLRKIPLWGAAGAPLEGVSVRLSLTEVQVVSGVIDVAAGYAYFGTTQGRVVKVALGAGDAPPRLVATVDIGDVAFRAAAIDPANGYAYFGGRIFNGTSYVNKIVKVALGEADTPPSATGVCVLREEDGDPTCAVIDSTNGYLLVGTSYRVVKVAVGATGQPPVRLGSADLPEDTFGGMKCGVIDPAGGYAYFGSVSNYQNIASSKVMKVALGVGGANPVFLGGIRLGSDLYDLTHATVDPQNRHLYFGNSTSKGYNNTIGGGFGNASFVKLTMGAGDELPGWVQLLEILPPGYTTSRALIAATDVARGVAYLGTSDNDGMKVTFRKVPLGEGAVIPGPVEPLAEEPAYGRYSCAAIDTVNDYGYFATDTVPGQVIKLKLTGPGEVPVIAGTLLLPAGVDKLACAVMDQANGYVYFGTNTAPGQVVKVAMGTGDAAPTLVGTLALPAGETGLRSAVIDTSAGQALFGTYTSPGRIVKVALGSGSNLPTRLGAVTLETAGGIDESYPYLAGTEAVDGYGYFVAGTKGRSLPPARLVKVDFGRGDAPPTRTGSTLLSSSLISTLLIDPIGHHAYTVTDHDNGCRPWDVQCYAGPQSKLTKMSLGAGSSLPITVSMRQLDYNFANIKCGAIDPANRYAYFVSREDNPADCIYVVTGCVGVNGIVKVRLDWGDDWWNYQYLDSWTPYHTSGDDYLAAAMNPRTGHAYFGSIEGNPRVITVSTGNPATVKSTRMVMPEPGLVDDFRFYSHYASGNLRLALYDDSATRTLLWESASTSDTVSEGLVTVPVSAGSPSSLRLAAGIYHVAWQSDSQVPVASHAAGAAGTGFAVASAGYGPFPTAIPVATSGTTTTENWTQFLTYSPFRSEPGVVHDLSITPGGGPPSGFSPLASYGEGSVAGQDSGAGALVATVTAGAGARVAGWFSQGRAQWLPVSSVGPDRIARARFAVTAGGQADPAAPETLPNMRLRLASRFAVTSMLEILHHSDADPGNTTLAAELRPSADPARPSVYTVDLDPVDVPYYATDPTEGFLVGFEAYSTGDEPRANGTVSVSEITVGSYAKSLVPGSVAPERSMSGADLGPAGAVTRAYNVVAAGGVSDPAELLGTVIDGGAEGPVFSTANVPADRIGVVGREFSAGTDPAARTRVEPGRQYHVRFHLTSTQATSLNARIVLKARAGKFAYLHKLEIGGGWPTGNVAGQTIARQALPGPGGANPDNDGAADAGRGGWYNLVFHTPLDPDIRADGPAGATIGQLMPVFTAEPGPGSPTAGSRRDLRVGLDLIDTLDSGPGAADEVGQVAVDRIEFRSYPAVGN